VKYGRVIDQCGITFSGKWKLFLTIGEKHQAIKKPLNTEA
jgi:hypothetical protein